MKKYLILIVAVFALTSCGKKEDKASKKNLPPQQVTHNEEISERLLQEAAQQLTKGDVKKAVVSLQGAIETNPADERGYLMLSEIFVKLESYENAITILERAAKIAPENPFVFYLICISHKELGNNIPALLAGRRSLELFQQRNDVEYVEKVTNIIKELAAEEQARTP